VNELSKVERQGVSCDFCHKIKDIHLKENKSVNTGVMQLNYSTSAERSPLFRPYMILSTVLIFSNNF